MARKRVLNVGQCDLDHGSLKQLLTGHFDVTVERSESLEDSLAFLGKQAFDLVLINRILDADGSDGLAVIRAIREAPERYSVPVMLVSNYAEAQESAVAGGAVRGFGKAELDDPSVIARLRQVLD